MEIRSFDYTIDFGEGGLSSPKQGICIFLPSENIYLDAETYHRLSADNIKILFTSYLSLNIHRHNNETIIQSHYNIS